jgi:hypothetical protein
MPIKQLSGLDASFLFLETPEMPMHVGAMHLLELPGGFRGRYVNALRRLYAARMPATPARGGVVDAAQPGQRPPGSMPEPDLGYHIVEHQLPSRKKGSTPQTPARCWKKPSPNYPQLLDRSKPCGACMSSKACHAARAVANR